MMMMSFVLRTTTTTSAPQNSVVVYVSHHHLHRGVVTDANKIVVGVVKLVVVAGNNKQRKQRSPLKRSFSLLLFSLLLNVVVLRAFLFSILCRDEMRFLCAKNIPFWHAAENFFADYFQERGKKARRKRPPLFSIFLLVVKCMANDVIFCAQTSDCTKITRTNNNRKELTTFSSII